MKINNRGLEPPQPMVRILQALEELKDGEELIAINDRQPMFLYAELNERGFDYETISQDDGSYKIIIQKKG
ncbi:DUF2249 domain-containing protein [Chengkuizengella axinellae]|uniref:DUF2249 domain-containing protein n=1 Tax=Chengkuizengella axinellae TaxID=3064388 RepID=A0ABT9IUK9_9BACL|nr:DUF2249 domain-containing protein [Chengkuizengella sp. 2205SS18-9]MDP5273021.1 DUF2249 domain-containing protein [Chengkuizengella sp. 2205SS18-9]